MCSVCKVEGRAWRRESNYTDRGQSVIVMPNWQSKVSQLKAKVVVVVIVVVYLYSASRSASNALIVP